MDRHWIIINYRSSLDLARHWINTWSASLPLDHHRVIIIGAISILLVTGSSIEPSLFHVGCRPSLHVGIHLLQHLYLTVGGTHPASMLERPTQHLYLTMGGTHPSSMSERHAQHSHLTMGGLACHHVRKARPTLISDHGRPSLPPCQKGPALTYDHGRPSLPPC